MEVPFEIRSKLTVITGTIKQMLLDSRLWEKPKMRKAMGQFLAIRQAQNRAANLGDADIDPDELEAAYSEDDWIELINKITPEELLRLARAGGVVLSAKEGKPLSEKEIDAMIFNVLNRVSADQLINLLVKFVGEVDFDSMLPSGGDLENIRRARRENQFPEAHARFGKNKGFTALFGHEMELITTPENELIEMLNSLEYAYNREGYASDKEADDMRDKLRSLERCLYVINNGNPPDRFGFRKLPKSAVRAVLQDFEAELPNISDDYEKWLKGKQIEELQDILEG